MESTKGRPQKIKSTGSTSKNSSDEISSEPDSTSSEEDGCSSSDESGFSEIFQDLDSEALEELLADEEKFAEKLKEMKEASDVKRDLMSPGTAVKEFVLESELLLIQDMITSFGSTTFSFSEGLKK